MFDKWNDYAKGEQKMPRRDVIKVAAGSGALGFLTRPVFDSFRSSDDEQAPNLAILSPQDNQTFQESEDIEVSAELQTYDEKGILEVRLNDFPIYEKEQGEEITRIHTTMLEDIETGQHRLEAIAQTDTYNVDDHLEFTVEEISEIYDGFNDAYLDQSSAARNNIPDYLCTVDNHASIDNVVADDDWFRVIGRSGYDVSMTDETNGLGVNDNFVTYVNELQEDELRDQLRDFADEYCN